MIAEKALASYFCECLMLGTPLHAVVLSPNPYITIGQSSDVGVSGWNQSTQRVTRHLIHPEVCWTQSIFNDWSSLRSQRMMVQTASQASIKHFLYMLFFLTTFTHFLTKYTNVTYIFVCDRDTALNVVLPALWLPALGFKSIAFLVGPVDFCL